MAFMNKTPHNLAIITGASGALGSAYLGFFRKRDDYQCVAIARSSLVGDTTGVVVASADLLDKDAVESAVNGISFNGIRKIVLVHPVGKFKFQYPSLKSRVQSQRLKQEMIESNVVTLEHVLAPLLRRTTGTSIRLTICAFGSISDRYAIPFWSAYSYAKNMLRRVLRSIVARSGGDQVRCLFVNVSSVDTGNENKLRPHADKRYWLKPETIVSETTPILTSCPKGYREIDVYRPLPKFDSTYFLDHKKILRKWMREMGVSKES